MRLVVEIDQFSYMLLTKKKKAKTCNFASVNNKAKWFKQNVADCFCKVQNHAGCVTLNTSGKYHCCFRSKTRMLFQIQKFFMSQSRHDQFPRLSRSEAETTHWHSEIETRPRHVSKHPALLLFITCCCYLLNIAAIY